MNWQDGFKSICSYITTTIPRCTSGSYKDRQRGSTDKERNFSCSTDKDAQAGSTVKAAIDEVTHSFRWVRGSTDKERK